MSTPKIELKTNTETLSIYINDHLHLYLIGRISGIQSWVESHTETIYQIEYTVDGKDYLTQYDNKQLWLKILKLIDKQIIKHRK